jgi:hypothetical protein
VTVQHLLMKSALIYGSPVSVTGWSGEGESGRDKRSGAPGDVRWPLLALQGRLLVKGERQVAGAVLDREQGEPHTAGLRI